MEPRFEFTFSYWIFAWFLLYYFGATSFNPKIWLIIALLANIYAEIAARILHLWTRPWIDIFVYICLDLVIKIMPIWILRDTPLRMKDFIAGIVFWVVFKLWMLFRLGSISEIEKYDKGVLDNLSKKKAGTPMIDLLHRWNVM